MYSKYQDPEMEIIKMKYSDIIVCSGDVDDPDIPLEEEPLEEIIDGE